MIILKCLYLRKNRNTVVGIFNSDTIATVTWMLASVYVALRLLYMTNMRFTDSQIFIRYLALDNYCRHSRR